jgi:hypothetical protein
MSYLPKIILLTLALSLFFAPPVLSQDKLDFERAYQDYTYNYDIYRMANSEDESYRLQYLQYKTLTSQENAREATVKMLSSRDDVVKTYLTALRTRLSETGGISDEKKNSLYSLIDSEVLWFTDHKDKIPSAGSLEDLVEDSDEAAKYYGDRDLMIYDTLVTIPIGRIALIREKQQKTLSKIKSKVSEIRGNGDKDTGVLERWILDTEARIQRSKEKESDALALVPKLKERQDKINTSVYDEILFKLSESLQYLKEANSFMREIVNGIKYED